MYFKRRCPFRCPLGTHAYADSGRPILVGVDFVEVAALLDIDRFVKQIPGNRNQATQ